LEIEYKKIINQKMGKEAKARGFKMVSLSPGITKWPIAIFKKSVDGHSQKYDINLDLVYNKVIFRCGKHTIEKKYEDEDVKEIKGKRWTLCNTQIYSLSGYFYTCYHA